MKKLLWLALLPFTAHSAPFLVADPYPTNVTADAIPTGFAVTISGITQPITTPAVPAGTNQVGMKLDLDPLNLSGSRTVTAKAKNVWRKSVVSAPLPFTAGPPTALGRRSNNPRSRRDKQTSVVMEYERFLHWCRFCETWRYFYRYPQGTSRCWICQACSRELG